MSTLKCSNCGGNLQFINNEYGYICDSCGCHKDVGSVSNDDADIINLANSKRIDDYKFEDALNLCRQLLAKDPKNQEANWCALLAEYQIIYLQNDEQKYVPTFLNPEAVQPMSKSQYYLSLNAKYRQEADAIEDMRQHVLEESKTITDYDVFISYKQHDKSNMETDESAWADELYKKLSKQYKGAKLRVFLDKVSLDESNAGWEPHIYAALRSAKVLVLLGSSLDNINSTWVKNEWKRFITYKKPIIVIGQKSNVDPTKLPDNALRAGQMINEEDGSWLKKAQKRVWDAVNKNKDISYLLYEAESLIRKKKFRKAKISYETVKSIDPKNAQAYWGLLKCRLKAFDDYDIVRSNKQLDKIEEFNNAIKYAVGADKERFEKVQRAQLDANKKRNIDQAEYPRENRNAWLKWSKSRRALKKIAIVLVACMLGAFGVYSYFGITQPIAYTVNGNEAILSGTSIYFNLVVDDLVVDKYKDYYVVKIEDGVLKNSDIKSATLGEHVAEIGIGAFENSRKLSTVTITSDYVTIGDNAFKNCVNLTNVVFGQNENKVSGKARAISVNSIGNSAFEGCSSLESLTVSHCSYIGKNAFSGCGKLKTLVLDLSDNATVETEAFENIGSEVTVKLPTVAESIYTKLSAQYSNIQFDTYTRDKIEECLYFIAKLSNNTDTSETPIIKAENLYNALSSTEKASITNYGVLQNARAAFNATAAIDGIGAITLDSESKILAAERAYDSLTTEQKNFVSNYAALQTARAIYNAMVLIEEIGVVTVDSEAKIITAEQAYAGLTYEQRDLVANYTKLASARAEVDTLISNNVINMINNIGIVTTESEGAISRAEEAYLNLTENQKNKIINRDVLTDARTVYNVINAIKSIGTVTASSGSAIQAAEALYSALTSAQKLKVINFSDLTDARVVYDVVNIIAAIGSVNTESQSDIANAEAAYAGLTENQKHKVSNYNNLTNAKVAYDTVLLIDAIGNVTLNSGTKIDNANDSYSALTSTQKSKVGNYSVLRDANSVYGCLTAIDGLGAISLNSLSAITNAENKYAALSSTLKSKITNYGTLTEARAIYDVMGVINQMGSLKCGRGSDYSYKTFTTSNMVAELNNSATRNSIDSITFSGLVSMPADRLSKLSSAFRNLETVRYDVTGGTSLSSFEFTPSNLTYRVIGSTSTYNISFTALSGDRLSIFFDNFVFSSNRIALDLTKVGTTKITFSGSCGMTSGSGCAAIDAKNLDIYLSITNTTIKAGNGESDSIGGIGIKATQLNIRVGDILGGSSLTIIGGNGGNSSSTGSKGVDAPPVTRHTVGNTGGVGGNGGNGVDGAAAVSANSVYVDSMDSDTIKFIGGNGGNGANGGNGGNGSQACETNINSGHTGDSLRGGEGGTGGKGGNGGNGGVAVIVSGSFTIASGKCVVTGGSGGTGGRGGDGGTGGKGGNNTIWFTGGGRGGNGGTGGKGGNGGSGGNVCNTTINAWNPSQLTQTNGSIGKKGSGGSGGIGGAGGNGTSNTGKQGDSGSPGASGTGA